MLSSKSKVYLLGLYEELTNIHPYLFPDKNTFIQDLSEVGRQRLQQNILRFLCPMNCDKQHIQERSAKIKFEMSQIYDLPFHKVAN